MEMFGEFWDALSSSHSLVAGVLIIATAIGAFFWIRSMVRSALSAQIDALKKVADDLHSHSTNVNAKVESIAIAADALNAAATTAVANFQTIRSAVEGTFGTALTRLGQSMQPEDCSRAGCV